MRGEDQQQGAMYSYISPEQRVPQEHPLRAIREIVDGVLKAMSPGFARLYAANGRPSIAPERLLRTVYSTCNSKARSSFSGAMDGRPFAAYSRGPCCCRC